MVWFIPKQIIEHWMLIVFLYIGAQITLNSFKVLFSFFKNRKTVAKIEMRRNTVFFPPIWLLFFSTLSNPGSCSADSISAGQSLFSNQTLVSKQGNFELGFFRPGNSHNYYIGIWYKNVSIVNKTYVWVANRNTPITDSTSSELKLLENGDLVLYDQSKNVVWSTNTTSKAMNSSQLVLGDNGNLVLINEIDVYWQSFDYPTDTLLPGAKLGYDKRMKKSRPLTSWKNPNDPAEGIYSIELDPIRGELMKWNGTEVYWNSGRWNGTIFSRIPAMSIDYMCNFSFQNNVNESYFTFEVYDSSITTRFVMDTWGKLKQLTWDTTTQQWLLFWSQPEQQCEVYAFCGANGLCNQNGLPFCKCTVGFEPRSRTDWNMADFSSGGCVRIKPFQCSKDEFYPIQSVKLPKNPISLLVASADECKSSCYNNCSCTAYSYSRGCSVWNGDLLGIQQLSAVDGYGDVLYLRVEVSAKSERTDTRAVVGVAAGIASSLVLMLLVIWRWRKRLITKGSIKKRENKELELPLYEIITIEQATNSFSYSSKIGHGGFGPVYKGILQTGETIAVKKLSKDSTQGLEELTNEVTLIAKLQHRNLVRLFGYCIHGDEMMLIYEYMHNKSLDLILFDKTKSHILNWEKRFNIVVGVARGLLYLHRDSWLRIIHRDLKAGNILLDSEMNPKISDFGIARTLIGDETQENTVRVAGTYGYMSPEYAIDGIFSMKSDVYSFGVLVLEIVCGKRNETFRHANNGLSLLGHAWKLLNEKKPFELLDPSVKESFTVPEVSKCIHIALLCVQKSPNDRPTMSAVLSMLDSDGVLLPQPKQPGFYTKQHPLDLPLSSKFIDFCTDKETTSLL